LARRASAALLILAVGGLVLPALVTAAAGTGTATRLFLVPLLACLVIAATHCYLGLHVIQREIIFVDLAFAQLASLGAVLSLIPYLARRSDAAWWCSFALVLVGSVLFTLSRRSRRLIPQEAVIGIVYAVATAGAIIVGDKLPGGLERVKDVLVGRVLWAGPDEVIWTAGIYAMLMVLHLLCFRPFAALSGFSGHDAQGAVSPWWDLLFYISFGLVIMRSVEIAGILLVFALLVVPAVIAVIFAARLGTRLVVAWGVAAVAAAAGIALSFAVDLPAGPTIVCLLGLGLAISGAWRTVSRSASGLRTVLKLSGLIGTTAAALFGIYLLSPVARGLETHQHDHNPQHGRDQLHNGESGGHREGSLEQHLVEHFCAAGPEERDAMLPQLRPHLSGILRLLRAQEPEVREHAAEVLAETGEPARASAALVEALADEDDPWVRLAMASALLRLDPRQGRNVLEAMLDGDAPLMVKAEAERLLRGRDTERNAD
jgi:zinc/manganese transport system permease protein